MHTTASWTDGSLMVGAAHGHPTSVAVPHCMETGHASCQNVSVFGTPRSYVARGLTGPVCEGRGCHHSWTILFGLFLFIYLAACKHTSPALLPSWSPHGALHGSHVKPCMHTIEHESDVSPALHASTGDDVNGSRSMPFLWRCDGTAVN